MKKVLLAVTFVTLQGCASYSTEKTVQVSEPFCVGSTELPAELAIHFEAVDDPSLLNETLAEPKQGKLCQAKVYQSKENAQVTIYRAWNSTNPTSKYGQWWAFNKPSGSIAKYREDYEICYQWSPLDKMVECTLKPATKVVVGNGQSAECSEYLSYEISDKQQVYLVDAASAVLNCTEYDGIMSWE